MKLRVDNDEIALRTAVSLSYLRPKEQEIVESFLADNRKISMKQAEALREGSADGELDKTAIKRIFEPGFFPEKVKPVKLSGQFLSQYFNESQSAEEIESVMAEALAQYFSNLGSR